MAQALVSAQSKLALRLAPASPILEGQMPLALLGLPSPSADVAQILSLVQEAVATGRRLTIQYARSERSRPRSIELVPQHLSLRENGWLLRATNDKVATTQMNTHAHPLGWVRRHGERAPIMNGTGAVRKSKYWC